jgi:hypothetical protein
MALLLLVGVPAASAHDERALSALTVIDSVQPNIDGLEVRVVHLGAPALVVRNNNESTVTVTGVRGEPFLRIGPRGVRMNASSPTAYLSLDPSATAVPPKDRLGTRPSWITVSKARTWSWFDPRIRYDRRDPTWQVPMSAGHRKVVVAGGFEPLQGHGHFLTRIQAPAVPDLQIRLVEGPVPALFVHNDTGETLLITGSEGEPMLRIGPDGVRANLRSPSYYTEAAQGILPVPSSADPLAPPEWTKVSDQPVWAWLEHRAVVPASDQERDLLGKKPATILTWRTPMTLGDRELMVRGHVNWVPPATVSHATIGDGGGLPTWLFVAALCLFALIALNGLRGRPAVT